MKIRINMTIDREQMEALSALAKDLRTSRSQVARLLLEAALQAAKETGRVGPLFIREVKEGADDQKA